MLHVESSGLRRFLFASAALVAVFVALCAFSAPAMAQTVYDSIPNPVPPSQVSYGFQAYSLRELGDHVQFAPSTSRNLKSISVNMVNWACENGTAATCTTTPGAAFAQPLEIMVYAVDHSTATPQAGALLASQLQTFQIPFRPSADPVCGSGGQWFSSVSGLCHNGYSVPVKFDFAPGIVLPDEVIWSIRYNTQTWGYSPTGVGGPYDSLNVGLSPAATVGTDVDPLGFFVYSQYPDPVEFCAVTLGVFTNATGCQGGYVPAAEIEMMEPACTTACYVNAATGNDLWSGTLTQPKKTIQAAIDAVQAGGTVFVYPGTYSETAAGRLLFNNSGPYQFGLFIDKNGVKLQGVDAAGAEILGSNASAPFIDRKSVV